MPRADETERIKRVQAGDAGAFEDLVNDYYEVIFKMAFKWCGDRVAAQDITQEACIKLARGIYSFKHNSAFSSWLYRLVINTAKDWFKSQNRHKQAAGDEGRLEVAAIGAADCDADDKIMVSQVLREVNKLPDGEKDALLLVVAQGLSHKEAANILGVKESTISWRIREARKKLADIFKGEKKYG